MASPEEKRILERLSRMGTDRALPKEYGKDRVLRPWKPQKNDPLWVKVDGVGFVTTSTQIADPVGDNCLRIALQAFLDHRKAQAMADKIPDKSRESWFRKANDTPVKIGITILNPI